MLARTLNALHTDATLQRQPDYTLQSEVYMILERSLLGELKDIHSIAVDVRFSSVL